MYSFVDCWCVHFDGCTVQYQVKLFLSLLIWTADCTQFLSENHNVRFLDGSDSVWIFYIWIRTEFWFPYIPNWFDCYAVCLLSLHAVLCHHTAALAPMSDIPDVKSIDHDVCRRMATVWSSIDKPFRNTTICWLVLYRDTWLVIWQATLVHLQDVSLMIKLWQLMFVDSCSQYVDSWTSLVSIQTVGTWSVDILASCICTCLHMYAVACVQRLWMSLSKHTVYCCSL